MTTRETTRASRTGRRTSGFGTSHARRGLNVRPASRRFVHQLDGPLTQSGRLARIWTDRSREVGLRARRPGVVDPPEVKSEMNPLLEGPLTGTERRDI
jgi:hypothetical protein